MVPWYSLVIWLPKTPKSHRSPVAPSSRKLWFSEDTQFWPKYSNGPGVAKSWQISKVTIRCHKRCLKLSWVQIWQKNSNGKCPKLPIRSAHALRYIGGLSVNLNHLKMNENTFQNCYCPFGLITCANSIVFTSQTVKFCRIYWPVEQKIIFILKIFKAVFLCTLQ